MENRKLIDFIMREYEQIQGELMIQEVFAKDVDERIMEIVNKTSHSELGSILAEIVSYQELGKKKYELVSRLEYLKGMMEAYSKIIAEVYRVEK